MIKRRVYDSEKHLHFVTFSCYRRRNHLSVDPAKRVVIGQMGARLKSQNGICLGFVIMPNHVHALVWFPEVMQLSAFMNKWKEQSSKAIKHLLESTYPQYASKFDLSEPIWQARYYGFNVYSRNKVEEKLQYMHENPVRAGLVENSVDWRWSSARWYENRKPVGVDISWPPGLEAD